MVTDVIRWVWQSLGHGLSPSAEVMYERSKEPLLLHILLAQAMHQCWKQNFDVMWSSKEPLRREVHVVTGTFLGKQHAWLTVTMRKHVLHIDVSTLPRFKEDRPVQLYHYAQGQDERYKQLSRRPLQEVKSLLAPEKEIQRAVRKYIPKLKAAMEPKLLSARISILQSIFAQTGVCIKDGRVVVSQN